MQGADVNAKNDYGQTPLDIAIARQNRPYSTFENKDMINFLLSKTTILTPSTSEERTSVVRSDSSHRSNALSGVLFVSR